MNIFRSIVGLCLTALLCACGGGDPDAPDVIRRQIGPFVKILAGHLDEKDSVGGGGGFSDGSGSAAGFKAPKGVAVDRAGNVYVADSSNHAIRKITPTGEVSTLAGNPNRPAGAVDGDGVSVATFSFPSGVAVDSSGVVYVADTNNNRIRKITAGVVTTVAVSGANFNHPRGLAVDSQGNIFVADSGSGLVIKIAPNGTGSIFANRGSPVGASSIALDSHDNLYVSDDVTHLILKISPSGDISTFAGSGPGAVDGQGTAASFLRPQGIVVDGSDNVYVADTGNQLIRKITPSGSVSIFAGTEDKEGADDDVTALWAKFYSPMGIGVDSAGNLYIGDTFNNLIRKITLGDRFVKVKGSS